MLAIKLIAIFVLHQQISSTVGYSLGNTAQHRNQWDGQNNMLIFPDINDKSTTNGVVERFNIYVKHANKPVHLGIFTPLGNNQYRYVGGIDHNSTAAGPNSVGVLDTPIAVFKNEILGFYHLEGGTIEYSGNNNECDTYTKIRYKQNVTSALQMNEIITAAKLTNPGQNPCRIYSYEAIIEPCPEGKFLVRGEGCKLCPIDHYQNENGTDSCKKCPGYTTTEGEGSISIEDCMLDPCPPGSYQKDEDCLKCPVGTYQEEPGQDICENCPDSYTTQDAGSTSISNCYPIDPDESFVVGSEVIQRNQWDSSDSMLVIPNPSQHVPFDAEVRSFRLWSKHANRIIYLAFFRKLFNGMKYELVKSVSHQTITGLNEIILAPAEYLYVHKNDVLGFYYLGGQGSIQYSTEHDAVCNQALSLSVTPVTSVINGDQLVLSHPDWYPCRKYSLEATIFPAVLPP